MNRGVLTKTVREVWVVTLIFAAAMAAVEALLAGVIPIFVDEAAGQILKVPFIRNMLAALLGTEIGDAVGPAVVLPLAWAHPLVLGLLAAQEVTHCTRMPAGEIDRGTIDVVLALPVSRRDLYVVETAVFVGAGAFVMMAGIAGHRFGNLFAPPGFVLSTRLLLMIVGNLFCLYLAVGGVAFAVSSLSNLRGRAIAVVLAIVMASFLLNFLAQMWAPAKTISWASVLTYYRPAMILREQAWPVSHMAVLLAIGVSCWTFGAVAFARRDICTV